jgi:pSer/pThr/pTyr-binding forkhead associated (FHA) protein
MVAKLIVASGKSAGRSITLKHGKILIGRAEECDIRPLGEEVSRRHCAVVEEAGAVTVEDLKSRNGTYVNGAKIAAKMSAVLLPRRQLARFG